MTGWGIYCIFVQDAYLYGNGGTWSSFLKLGMRCHVCGGVVVYGWGEGEGLEISRRRLWLRR